MKPPLQASSSVFSPLSSRDVEHRLYSITTDLAGIVRIDRLTVLTEEQVDDYLRALSDVLESVRRKFGRVRLFADLRNSPVRAQAAAEKLRIGNQELYRPGDKVALLIASSLLKMQLQRNIVPEYQALFTTVEEAEAWLQSV